jgi:hypothetical protein
MKITLNYAVFPLSPSPNLVTLSDKSCLLYSRTGFDKSTNVGYDRSVRRQADIMPFHTTNLDFWVGMGVP